MAAINDLLGLYILVLWLRAILSWVIVPARSGVLSQIYHVTYVLTEPLLAPIRRVMPRVGVGGVGIDLSVFVLMLLVYILRAYI